ncbi:hypothetical protein ZOSMA_265G00270 [Zostera marina]|uniref:At2g35280-like TPR domain-containing protein n=1 Tax=Zostera marina TaxID=29655 RepID=A0A0K9PEL8_ZOSMR|nr:hypothetical protein ZOSMA_265G00270 [Zostera marina]
MMLSCTRFDNLGRDKHVLRRVYIDKLISWKTVPAFFDRCIDAENLNALFIKGLNECFNYRRFESGIHYFLKASEKGSRKSSYVLGMIYFSADFSRCDGIRLLRKITDGRKDGLMSIEKMNLKVKFILKRIWINHKLVVLRSYTKCKKSKCSQKTTTTDGWNLNNCVSKTNDFCSEFCMWNHCHKRLCELFLKLYSILHFCPLYYFLNRVNPIQ